MTQDKASSLEEDPREADSSGASDAFVGYAPVLSRVPDARLGKTPLLHPILFGYLALALGSAVAAGAAFYNALSLRLWREMAVAFGLGLAGWFGCHLLVNRLWDAGFRNIPLLLLTCRLCHVAIGALLALSQWSSFRGHRFLGGGAVSLVGAVVTGIALQFVLPPAVFDRLLGIF